MQSSRRKRDRAGNEDKAAAASTTSRTRGARGAPAQKKLHLSPTEEEETGSSAETGNGASVVLSQHVNSTKTSGPQIGDNGTSGESAVQQLSASQMSSEGATSPAAEVQEGGGNNSESPKSSAPQNATVETSERTDPAISSQQRDTLETTVESTREERILALLTHRRMLLDRIKQCRASAENRLESSARRKEHPSKQGDVKTIGEGDSSEERRESGETDVSDSAEIAAFQELSRKAINAAKKQRSDVTVEGQQHEKRSQISLRRGSSVGKRMTMALSSLAPNVAGVPTPSTRDSQTLPLHQQNVASTSAVPVTEGQLTSSAVPQPVASSLSRSDTPGASSGQRMGSQTINAASYKQQPLLPTPAAEYSGQGSHAARTGAGPGVGQKIKRTGSKRGFKTYNTTSSRGISEPHMTTTLPLHIGASGSSLPLNTLTQSSVICPEAAVLRERRNLIRSQLASLLYEREKRMEDGDVRLSILQQKNKQIPPHTFQHPRGGEKPAPPSFASVVSKQRGPGPPEQLPRRRKTHWDYLLEEMRWLATDFIEERKWKASCSRTLSSAVVSTCGTTVSSVSSKTQSRRHTLKTEGTFEGDPDGQNVNLDVVDNETNKKSDCDTDAQESDEAQTALEQQKQYEAPTATDEKATRTSAAIISDMIAELWDITVEGGAMCKSDVSQTVSLERHLKLRQKLLKEDKHEENMSEEETLSKGIGLDANAVSEEKLKLTNTPLDNHEKGDYAGKVVQCNQKLEELSYDRISERVEISMNNAKKRIQGLGGNVQHPEEVGKIVLTPSQSTATAHIKTLWGGDAVSGAVLSGVTCSGKTTAVCTLLWSRRNNGPQLVICSPARVIRWKHELSQFMGLRILTLGLTCGIGSPELVLSSLSSYGPCDVILCEFSSVNPSIATVASGEKERMDMNAFRTVTLDCRHPSEYAGACDSPSPLPGSLAKDPRHRRQSVPPELVSSTWWDAFLSSLSSTQPTTKRLLVERSGLNLNQKGNAAGYFEPEDRQGLEYLAAKAAFVLGPTFFYSKRNPLPKRVLSWTKRRAKADRKEGVANDRLDEMKKFLFRVLQRFSYNMEVTRIVDPDGPLNWSVRLCSLPLLQRSQYERCCFDVRGALSLGRSQNVEDSRLDPRADAGYALLRLRKVCVHPHIQEMLFQGFESGKVMAVGDAEPGAKSTMSGRDEFSVSGSGCLDRRAAPSSSQPHVELALKILESSAKLRELVFILRFECGYQLHGEEAVVSALGKPNISKLQKKEAKAGLPARKKVAVLASLAEAQLLTSVLLSSIGLEHELLMRSSSIPDNDVGSVKSRKYLSSGRDDCLGRAPPIGLSSYAPLAWIECQLALARFNSEDPPQLNADSDAEISLGRAGKRSVDLIVASPVTVASQNGGIGVISADLVVSLDEDWSGRGEMLMRSIRLAHQLKNEASSGSLREGKESAKFVRLVCADTCEENFLSAQRASRVPSHFQENTLSEEEQLWPSDLFGYLCLTPSYLQVAHSRKVGSSDVKKRSKKDAFSFPGIGIRELRNTDLSTVLCSQQPLPPDFATGSQTCFLPTLEASAGNQAARERTDGLLSDWSQKEDDISLLNVLMQYEAWSCPLSCQHSAERKRGCQTDEKSAALCRFLTIAPPLPADVPPMVFTRRDVFALPSRSYMETFGRSSVWERMGAVSASSGHAQPDTLFLLGPSEDNGELADAWHKSGLSCKPDDFAASLLLYSCPQIEKGDDPDSVDARDTGSKKRARISKTSGEQAPPQSGENYVAPVLPDSGTMLGNSHGHKIEHRSNAYSRWYSASRSGRSTIVHDGNQGCEPRVYFPPLFPNMVLCSELAKADIVDMGSLRRVGTSSDNEAKTSHVVADPSEASRKRKVTTESDLPASRSGKRPRIHLVPSGTAATSLKSAGNGLVGSNRQVPSTASVLTETKQVLGASDFSVEPSIIPEDYSASMDATSFLMDLNEDYGLAGIGALSVASDSARAAASNAIDVASYSSWRDPYESNTVEQDHYSDFLACDTEEADAATHGGLRNFRLDTMILFVGKPKLSSTWGASSVQYFPSGNNVGAAGALTSNFSWSSTNASSRTSVPPASTTASVAMGNGVLNGSGISKKKKKSQNHNALSSGSSAFSRLTTVGFPGGAAATTFVKDGNRNKMMPTFNGRDGRQGLTLFDYSSFKLAYVRIRNKVSDRVTLSSLESSVSSGVGPGVPLCMLETDSLLAVQSHRIPSVNEQGTGRWTSLVDKISVAGSELGAQARSLSMSQRATLRRSLVSPRRVDFGPFQAGYLSSTSGMTAISPPSARVGVSLPMGVKIANQQREQQLFPWSPAEDKKLQNCAVRFGLNFHLAARVVGGVEGKKEPSHGKQETDRSARQCRERWNRLVKDQPSLAIDVKRYERTLRENALLKPDQVAQSVLDYEQKRMKNVLSGDRPLQSSGGEDYCRVRVFGDCTVLLPFGLTDMERSLRHRSPQEAENGMNKSSDPGSSDLEAREAGRRSFGSLRNAALKKQDVQITIPGCIGGEGTPSLVPSHPSHLQSIQSAVAGIASSNGRSDMWPLQILDIADKKREASQGSTGRQQPNAAVKGVTRSNGSSVPQGTQSNHQQQSSPYQQHVQHTPPRSSHHQRIAPAIQSPSRSPLRASSAMSSGSAPPPVNQQYVAPQPPGRSSSTDAHAASLATSISHTPQPGK